MNIEFAPNTPILIKEKIISDWNKTLPKPLLEIIEITSLFKKEILNDDLILNDEVLYMENIFPIYLNILKSEKIEDFIDFLGTFFSVQENELFENRKYKVFISAYLDIKTSSNQAYLYVCNHDKIIEALVKFSYFGSKLIYYLDHLGIAWIEGEYDMYINDCLFWQLGHIESALDAKIALFFTLPDLRSFLHSKVDSRYQKDNRPPEIEINFSNGKFFNLNERLDFVTKELFLFVESYPEIKIFSSQPDYSSEFHYMSKFVEPDYISIPILGKDINIFKCYHSSYLKEELYFIYDSANRKDITIGMDLTTFVVLLLNNNEFYVLKHFLTVYNSNEIETSFDLSFTEQEKKSYYKQFSTQKTIVLAKKNSEISSKIRTFLSKKNVLNENIELFINEVASDVFNSISYLQHYTNFNYIKLEKDRKLVLEAIKKDIENIIYAPPFLRKDKEFVLEVISILYYNDCIKKLLKHIPKKFKKDREIIEALAKQDGLIALEYAHPSLRKDENIVLEAVSSNGYALRYAHLSLRKNRNIVMEAVANCECQHWDYDNMLPLIHYIPSSLKKDRQLILKFLEGSEWGLQYVHSIFKKDKEIISSCVQRSGWTLEYANILLRKDKEIVLQAIQCYPLALQFAHQSIKRDKEICLEAINRDEYAFEFVDASLKKDKDFIKIAMNHFDDPSYIFQYLDESIKKDTDFIFEIIKLFKKIKNANLIYVYREIDITLKLDYTIVIEILRHLISEGNYLYEFFNMIPNALKRDKKFILEAIKLDIRLDYINNSWWTDREFVVETQEFLPKEYFDTYIERIDTIESFKRI